MRRRYGKVSRPSLYVCSTHTASTAMPRPDLRRERVTESCSWWWWAL